MPRRSSLVLLLSIAAPALVFAQGPAARGAAHPLILATTTSTQDSGLLDVLLPLFQSRTGIPVKAIAVGTGEALAMGRRGDADVLLVHAREAEDEFMAAGYGKLRRDVMHNEFVIAGPAGDPAGASGLAATDALHRIAVRGARFVSRGDDSGTHKKEKALWAAAQVVTAGKPWYESAGQGMAETMRVASERQAYVLADRATWIVLQATVDLKLVVDGGKDLRNPYGVIVVNPAKVRGVQAEAATRFADWLVSAEAQEAIGDFGRAKVGRSLFVPDAR